MPWGGGDGMEHRNSTVVAEGASIKGNVRSVLGTVSHEFFHAWNVERIRPRTLEPFDLEDANMSGELWLAEGFTQYYGQLIMARAALRRSVDDVDLAIRRIVASRTRPFPVPSNEPMRRHRRAAQRSTNCAYSLINSYQRASVALARICRCATVGGSSPWRIQAGAVRCTASRRRDGLLAKPYTMAEARDRLAEMTTNRAFAEGSSRVRRRREVPLSHAARRAGVVVRKRNPGRLEREAIEASPPPGRVTALRD